MRWNEKKKRRPQPDSREENGITGSETFCFINRRAMRISARLFFFENVFSV